MTKKADELLEMAEDTCDVVLADGTRCGEHIGFGMRLFHLRRCDDHSEDDAENEQGLLRDDVGQDLVEYVLLIALIALAVVAAFPPVTAAITTVFTNVAAALTGGAP